MKKHSKHSKHRGYKSLMPKWLLKKNYGLKYPMPKFKIEKIKFSKMVFVKVPTFKGDELGLIFNKKPSKRQVAKKLLEFYNMNPNFWYHHV